MTSLHHSITSKLFLIVSKLRLSYLEGKHLFFYILALVLCTSTLQAQEVVWDEALEIDSALPIEWQGDREHYTIHSGAIRLKAPAGASSSLITRSIELGEDTSWQGVVRMSAMPTTRNYSYILLALIKEQDTERRYLALAFGGPWRGICLCEASFLARAKTEEGKPYRYTHAPERDLALIEQKTFSPKILTGISYQVVLGRDKSLLLYLSDDEPTQADLVEQIEYKAIEPKQSHFGIYSAYTDRRREGIALSDIRLIHGLSKEQASDDEEGENKPSKPIETDFLISEVMPNPKTGSAEYIELYHRGEVSASLSNYSLGIGATRGSIRIYSMARLADLLSPGGYYLLTSNPDAIIQTYPTAKPAHIILAQVPQLRNAGFVLQLYRGKQLVDEVEYDPKKLGRGLMSRKGVAYERSSLSVGAVPWHAGGKEQDYATPTRANSMGGHSASEADREGSEDAQLVSELVHRLETEQALRVEIDVYSPSGQRLAHIPEGDSLNYLRRLQDNAYDALRPLVGQSSLSILYIELEDKEGERERYSLKYHLQGL